MDILKRIDEIMKKQNLNDYQLSKLSGLSTSTISNMRKRNTIPSIATLEYICDSLDMTLSQFFVEENTNLYPVTDKQKDFLDYFVLLTDRQQDLLLEIVKSMHATYGEKMEQKHAAASEDFPDEEEN
ncbi:helix-turn-helix domain-containing protein [uncultured Eubacterium sp.]|mgnify:FL=1|uniref:helix-turn-helix domain-containing protein n=1 Tax=uncultured Eubacterium sp. TaxID=165185 RepID=UPI0025E447EF|nr:helix-turn-helix domain-containing protein [uncultured Eubacterium sp.]